LKEKEAKRSKNLADLSLCQCSEKLERARLSPRVMFARALQTFGGTARRKNASQAFYGLQMRYRR
jgi:hypothetical protein